MAKFHTALSACCGAALAVAALTMTAEARGGGGFGGGHGGFSGGFNGPHAGGFEPRPGGGGYGQVGPGGVERGYRPGGPGYGPVPGRRNPYAMGAVPFISMDYNDLLQTPPNNTGSRLPNDCNYLYARAIEAGTPDMWRLFNDCAHNR